MRVHVLFTIGMRHRRSSRTMACQMYGHLW